MCSEATSLAALRLKLIYIVLLFVTVAGGMTSCSPHELEEGMIKSANFEMRGDSSDIADLDSLLMALRPLIAKAQESSQFRNWIKETAGALDSSEYSIPFLYYMNQPYLGGTITLGEHLAGVAATLPDSNGFSESYLRSTMLVKFPEIGLNVYTGRDDVDPSQITWNTPLPVVAYTSDLQRDDDLIWKTLDSNGQETALTYLDNEPSQPAVLVDYNVGYIVMDVSTGEAAGPGGLGPLGPLDACGDSRLAMFGAQLLLASTSETILVDGVALPNPEYGRALILLADAIEAVLKHCTPEPPGGGGGSTENAGCVAERDGLTTDEVIVAVDFNQRSALKDWCGPGRRKCRIRFFVIWVTDYDNPALGKKDFILELKRRQLKQDEPTYFNFPVGLPAGTWDFKEGHMGDLMKYKMIGMHKNPDGESNFTLGVTAGVKFILKAGTDPVTAAQEQSVGVNASVGFKKANNDKEFGEWFVNYCDPIFENPREPGTTNFTGRKYSGSNVYDVLIREGGAY